MGLSGFEFGLLARIQLSIIEIRENAPKPLTFLYLVIPPSEDSASSCLYSILEFNELDF